MSKQAVTTALGGHKVRQVDPREALWLDVSVYASQDHASGFAGGAFDPDGHTLNVYWAGDSPAQLTRLAANRASGDGVAAARMTVHRVAENRAQFVARARQVVAAAQRAGMRVWAGRTRDFTGMQVDVEGAITTAQRAFLETLGATVINDGLGASVPLVGGSAVDTGSDHRPTSTAKAVGQERFNPVRGGSPGGQVITDEHHVPYCSTGWNVQTADGKPAGMVTAQHCSNDKPTYWYTWGECPGCPQQSLPVGPPVGPSESGHSLTDSMIINNGAPHGTPPPYDARILTGAWDTDFAAAVRFAQDPAFDQMICADGGMTGEVCGVRVDKVDTLGPDGAGPGFYAGTATAPTPFAVAGRGDSGGPAESPMSDFGVILHGMIQNSIENHVINCPGGGNPWQAFRDRPCFYRVFFVNQSAISAAHHLYPQLYNEPGCTITGTAGNDTLYGTVRADVICGLGGDDIIEGGNGDDTLHGGPGNDTLGGGNGNDTLDGAAGNDRLEGGNGNDVQNGGPGDDTIGGGNDDDYLEDTSGTDNVHGGNGNDTINVRDGAGGDTANGGLDNNTCIADSGDTTIGCQ
ncbi:hypothetical protein ILP97_31725 [Amycolatopsis sp. H6(2020)]|nr:hypothetical protein [Amycolatopsis sp. H6(2020)]